MSPLALVTGASSGIGRATAIALARSGASVVAVARRPKLLEGLASDPALPVEGVVADVTVPEDRARVFAAVGDRPLAALVHAAGVFPRAPLARMTREEWDAAMRTNVDARLWMTLGLRERLRGGRVLFVGSDAATTARHGGAAYSVSKAASAMLWTCLAAELGDEVAFAMAKPGLVETAMLDDSLAADRERFGAGEVYAAMADRGETIAAEKVGAFFRWLLRDAGREEFARVWDIRDESHHREWLDGSLYTGAA